MSERTGNTTPTDDRGHGGEIHQGVQNDLVLTTAQGAPVSDDMIRNKMAELVAVAREQILTEG